MPYCAVSGCHNSGRLNAKRPPSERVMFFRFPHDLSIINQWLQFCARKCPINVENSRICSIHFTPDDRENSLRHRLLGYSPTRQRTLKRDAVPSKCGPKSQLSDDVREERKLTHSFLVEQAKKQEVNEKGETSVTTYLERSAVADVSGRQQCSQTPSSIPAVTPVPDKQNEDQRQRDCSRRIGELIPDEDPPKSAAAHNPFTFDPASNSFIKEEWLDETETQIEDHKVFELKSESSKESLDSSDANQTPHLCHLCGCMVSKERLAYRNASDQRDPGTKSDQRCACHSGYCDFELKSDSSKDSPDSDANQTPHLCHLCGCMVSKERLAYRNASDQSDSGTKSDPQCTCTDSSSAPGIDCDFATSNVGVGNDHVNRALDDARFACNECHYVTNKKQKLTLHKNIHSRRYACGICEFTCYHHSFMLKHLKKHSNELVPTVESKLADPRFIGWKCRECSFVAKNERGLQRHVKSHQAVDYQFPPRWKCGKCDFKSHTEDGLKSHFNARHMLKCKYCDVYCANRKSLDEHMVGYHNSKPHSVLTLINSGKRADACDLCGVSVKRSMDVHMRFTHKINKIPVSLTKQICEPVVMLTGNYFSD